MSKHTKDNLTQGSNYSKGEENRLATTKFVLDNTWQLLATASQSFIIDNASSYDAEITFQDDVPSVDAPFHTLSAGQGMFRMNITGNVYGRDSASMGEAFLIVST